MPDHLRIAITADPELPVPPRHYGGIERVIHGLIEHLAAAGHRVALFAHRDSVAPCQLIPYPGGSSTSPRDTVRNGLTIASHVVRGRFDVIHSFGRLQYLAPLAWLRMPKVMTYQRPITKRSITRAVRLFRGDIEFTACSRWMTADVKRLASWHVVYNGVPVQKYRFSPSVSDDAPLVFLGRIEHIKGPHLAIEAARRTCRRLILAGNVQREHQQYFDAHIRPHVDGKAVTFVGPIDDAQKNDLLGSAAALLMPVLWDEPFGIVMAEALACGTPVIGLRRGSIPEVVDHLVTGFVATDADGLVDGIGRIRQLHRSACRRAAECRFSDSVVASQYEAVYRGVLRRARGGRLVPAAARF